MKKLNKEDMKSILGGMMNGGTPCWTTDQCPCGQRCDYKSLDEIGTCTTVAQGSACNSDSDCGAGQKCVKFTFGSGGYCNTGTNNV